MRSFVCVPAVLLALIAGCAQNRPKSPAPMPLSGDLTAAVETPAARVVTLETRSHVIHILAGERYTVETPSGTVIAANLESEQFRSRFPELWHVAHEGIADVTARNRQASSRRLQERQASGSRP